MVTLTNSTTSTPSVSDMAVSSVGGTNTYQDEIVNFGTDTILSTTATRTSDVIYYRKISIDKKVFVDSLNAYIYDAGTGDVCFALILDENSKPIEKTEEISIPSSYAWTEFDFGGYELEAGTYYIGVHANGGLGVKSGSYPGGERKKKTATYTGDYNMTGATQTNFNSTLSIYLKTRINKLTAINIPTSTFGEGEVTSTISGLNTNDYLVGAEIQDFPGGITSRMTAYFETTSRLTGEIRAAIYLDGLFFIESFPVSFTNEYYFKKKLQFKFGKDLYIPPGNLTIIVNGSANIRVLGLSVTPTTNLVFRPFTYGETLPLSMSFDTTTTAAPSFEIITTDNDIYSSSTNNVTWRRVTDSWNSLASYTWDDFTGITNLSNI